MAKDKSKKKFKDGDEFAKPSEAPAGGDEWKFTTQENVGALFLISPLREDDKPAYGKAGERGERQQIIVADIVELNEKKPGKSVEHSEVWIFAGWVKGALRGYIGERRVLARLAQDASKSEGDRPAWVLEDADEDDVEIAKAYLASVDPFAQKGASSDDDGDEDDAPKKSKKKGKKKKDK